MNKTIATNTKDFISDMPERVLTEIFTWLDLKDMGSVKATSTLFNQVVNFNSDLLYSPFYIADLKIKKGNSDTFKDPVLSQHLYRRFLKNINRLDSVTTRDIFRELHASYTIEPNSSEAAILKTSGTDKVIRDAEALLKKARTSLGAF